MNSSLLNELTEKNILDRVICLEEVTSTNTLAKEYALLYPNENILVISEIQTAGRGRLGRVWESPYGTGIWMSILIHPKTDISKISRITLISALAIAKAIDAKVQIKWPNDVIINGKKVCGILTEMVTRGNENDVICGIGINVNTKSFPDELSDKATSIFLETGKITCREELTIAVVKNFMSYYSEFLKNDDLSFILDEYNSLLISRGKEVILSDANNTYNDNPYTALYINKEGALIVSDKNKKLHEITYGEVSVRGVLGYV